MRTRRGQTLALFALTALLLAVMALITFSIGMTAARRADLNNVADAAALSQATATARTFNASGVMNRAVVAHYVAMGGVHAQMSYSTLAKNLFVEAGNQFRMYDLRVGGSLGTAPPGAIWDVASDGSDATCSDRTWEIRDASYEMWHAGLRFYNGVVPSGDQAAAYCDTRVTRVECLQPQQRLTRGINQLERAAAEQVIAIHDAIWDLAQVQRATHAKLIDDLDNDRFARRAVSASGLPVRADVTGGAQAENELDRADESGSKTFRRPFAQAVMGTRTRRPLVLQDTPENVPPLTLRMKRVTDAAMAAYSAKYNPGGPQLFRVQFGEPDTSFDFSQEPVATGRTESPLVPYYGNWWGRRSTPSIDYVFGRALLPYVHTDYFDRYNRGCRGPATTRSLDSDYAIWDPVLRVSRQPQLPYTVIRTQFPSGTHSRSLLQDGMPYPDATNRVSESDFQRVASRDGMHEPMLGGGCHGNHEHYGYVDWPDAHGLKSELMPIELLSFVLPDASLNEDGARGIWGQPRQTVLLSQAYDANRDPWTLRLRFQFSPTGANLDMKAAYDRINSAASAVTYYHRRGHLGEPPNLLNPFWHATLSANEVDERPNDPTSATQAPLHQMYRLISSAPAYSEQTAAGRAYRRLTDRVEGMRLPPTERP